MLNIKKDEFYLRRLYGKISGDIFDSHILSTIPQTLLIYRLALNYGIRSFSEIIGCKRGKLTNIELGKKKFISKEEAELYMGKIKWLFNLEKMDKIQFDHMYNNSIELIKKSKIDSNRAKELRRLVKPRSNVTKAIKTNTQSAPKNCFEEKIQELLTTSGINFGMHYLLETKSKVFIVDFIVFKNKNPKVVIEVKQSCSTNIKRRYDLLRYYAILIDHKMQIIKLTWPT